jgi:pullulanase/glycogen debranching enzyme
VLADHRSVDGDGILAPIGQLVEHVFEQRGHDRMPPPHADVLHALVHARGHPRDLGDAVWLERERGDDHINSVHVPRPEDWHDPAFRCLGVELRHAAEDGGTGTGAEAIFAVFNSGAERDVVLPHTAPGWRLILDTTRPTAAPAAAQATVAAPAHSVLVFEAMTPSEGPP